MSLIDLPDLRTFEGGSLHAANARLDLADTFAEQMIAAGLLINTDGARVRLFEAIDKLAGVPARGDDDDPSDTREPVAYLIGLAVGIRFGRMSNGGAR
jgi:hypothetical protein